MRIQMDTYSPIDVDPVLNGRQPVAVEFAGQTPVANGFPLEGGRQVAQIAPGEWIEKAVAVESVGVEVIECTARPFCALAVPARDAVP